MELHRQRSREADGRRGRGRLAVAAALLLVIPLSAQQPATVIWDDPTPLLEKPTTYILTLEMTVPATKDTPCTNCLSIPVLLPTAPGTYTIQVAGRNAKGTTSVASWVEVTGSTTGNLIPPATSLTDDGGAVWTRTASTSRIYRNGVWVATGTEVLYLPTKKRVYYHGANGLWFEYHAPWWWTWGPTMPS